MKAIFLSGRSKLHLKKTCAAIGIFDGVHRGHQYLVKQVVAAARRLRARPIVITFFPHPVHALRPDLDLGYLTSLTDRFRLLGGLGIASCIVVPFNKSFARIPPQKFIEDILVKKLGVRVIFVGKGFTFGKDRSGDITVLNKYGSQYGYEAHAIPSLKQGREIISSTRIRQLVKEGKLNGAAKLLGRSFSVSGKIVKGSQRGKNLGFPTANLSYEADILPPQGVYAVKAVLGEKEYPAVANIGTRPSFEKQKTKLHLEVHILDFSRNIYGKHLEVKFLKKLRNEKKFPNPKLLIRQIQKDVSNARKYI